LSEGPQVKLKAEWLNRWLAGREIRECRTSRESLKAVADDLPSVRCRRVFCKGKRIFLEFENGLYLHNHLLMRGRWRKMGGRLLLLPPGAWLALYVGPHTVCNFNGQVLDALDHEGVERILRELGPDTMAVPFPEREIRCALKATSLPIAEALLDQSIMCGIGNQAKSEALHVAGIDPTAPANGLGEKHLTVLCRTIRRVMWESYHQGGRWTTRVYRRRGQRCEGCGGKIQMVRQRPSNRSTYYCPSCQVGGTLFDV